MNHRSWTGEYATNKCNNRTQSRSDNLRQSETYLSWALVQHTDFQSSTLNPFHNKCYKILKKFIWLVTIKNNLKMTDKNIISCSSSVIKYKFKNYKPIFLFFKTLLFWFCFQILYYKTGQKRRSGFNYSNMYTCTIYKCIISALKKYLRIFFIITLI